MNLRESCSLAKGLRDLVIMEKITFTTERSNPSSLDEPKAMIARGNAAVPREIPVIRDFPTLVSPLKMDHTTEESMGYQEASVGDVQQIRVSYSDPSLEHAASDGDFCDDERVFNNAVMMGRNHQRLGNYKQALQQYRTALQCKNRTIDSESQSIQEEFGNVLHDIANIHLTPGFDDRMKCIEAFHFCLDIRRNCLGSYHPDVASVLYKLAFVYSSFGEHQYALDLLLEAVSILLSDSTRETAPYLIQVWTAIGKVQQALGEEDEAESSFREAEEAEKLQRK